MSKLIDSRIRWYHGFANRPSFEFLLADPPEEEDFIYTRRGELYYANNDNMVRFFAHQGPDDGYGGREFNLRMADGTIETLIGPWSSRASVMNGAGFPACVDCYYTYKKNVWKRNRTEYAGAVCADFAIRASEYKLVHLHVVDENKETKPFVGRLPAETVNTPWTLVPSASPWSVQKQLEEPPDFGSEFVNLIKEAIQDPSEAGVVFDWLMERGVEDWLLEILNRYVEHDIFYQFFPLCPETQVRNGGPIKFAENVHNFCLATGFKINGREATTRLGTASLPEDLFIT